MRLLVAGVAGIILGILFAHLVFLGGWITLGLWGVVGLGIGAYGRDKKEAIINGAIYGFVVSFAFLVADYNGAISVVYRLFPFALLSLLGALCGFILGLVGFLLSRFLLRK